MVRKAKKTAKKSAAGRDVLFEVHPLMDSRPLVPFMCFDTPQNDVFIKCDWNPDQRRFNANCRQVGPDECRGSE